MTGKFIVDRALDQCLPGLTADYIGTDILDGELRELSEDRATMLRALSDPFPLPTTEAREGYFGDRHFEFWLSGARDAQRVMKACVSSLPVSGAKVLDFGGASGRVARHLSALLEGSSVFLSDSNPAHVQYVRHFLKGAVTGIYNTGQPHLPFDENTFDVVCAFSVFTHIYDLDMAWLLELRRIVKPGGALYLTLHDGNTWKVLANTYLSDLCFSNPDFHQYYLENPELKERVVHFYNESGLYDCNVFFSQDYVSAYWGPHFADIEFLPLAHDHQSAVRLTTNL